MSNISYDFSVSDSIMAIGGQLIFLSFMIFLIYSSTELTQQIPAANVKKMIANMQRNSSKGTTNTSVISTNTTSTNTTSKTANANKS
jgi:hypothetical protein